MELFQQYPWQWFFSGGTEGTRELTHAQIEDLFSKWRSIACRVTGLQIGSVGCSVRHNGRHCHALLVGANRKGKTLRDIDTGTIKTLERLWFALAQSTARIDVCRDTNASGYVVFKNLVGNDAEVMVPQGKQCLKKYNLTT